MLITLSTMTVTPLIAAIAPLALLAMNPCIS
jgi:hypothetical protein